MDRHKVGTEPLVKATTILARNGYATSRSLSLDIPCSRGTADRIVAYLKATGDYVKQGYGIVPKDSPTRIPPHSPTFEHSPTFPHKDSPTPKESTTYKDSPTFEHPPTKIPPHSPTNILSSQTLNYKEAVQNGPRSGEDPLIIADAADGEGFCPGMEEKPETAADRSGGLSRMGASTSGSQKEIEEPAPFPLALSGAADEEQQPWGPDENEQASLEYQEDLARKHKTKEITGLGGAGASHRSVCDGGIDMAAYQQDLDKLIGVLSIERDAWKLGNRQLGKARGEGKISRLELCRGKRNHNELLRVIHDLTKDRESGELRYANLQAAGETLDITWTGWRQKMATDPELIQHYRDTAAQLLREARKEAWEAKRYAAQELQDEIAATKIQEPAPEPDTELDPVGSDWDDMVAEAEAERRERAPQEDRPSRIAREDREHAARVAARQTAQDAEAAAQEPAEVVEEPASPPPDAKASLEARELAEKARVTILELLSYGDWVSQSELFDAVINGRLTREKQQAWISAISYLVSTGRVIEDGASIPSYLLAEEKEVFA